MAGPAPDPGRAAREARRFAADARRIARRGRRRLSPEASERLEAACVEVEDAAAARDPVRLSDAVRALDALWGVHLDRLVKPRWREYGEPILAAVLLALAVRALVVEGFRIPSGSMAPTLLPGDHVLVSKLAYGPRVPFTRLRLSSATPRRGDVVVFESPRDPSVDVVKRVVGIAGDVVELREQILHVNGVPQPRSPTGELALEDRDEGTGAPVVDTCRRYREALARGELAAPDDGDPAAVEASWQTGAAAGVATYDVLQCRRARIAAREGPYEVVAPGHVFVLGDNRDRSADSRGAGGWQVPVDHVKGRAVAVYFSWGEGGAGRPGGPRLDRLFKPVE